LISLHLVPDSISLLLAQDLIKDLQVVADLIKGRLVSMAIDHLLIINRITEVLVQTFLLALLSQDLRHLGGHMREWDLAITILKVMRTAMTLGTS
jgi:hypothetical protein